MPCHGPTGVGNFQDYWDLIYKYDQLQGGFIWDWVDQTFAIKDENQRDIWAFWRRHGICRRRQRLQLLCQRLIAADRTPHPHIYEVKKVLQYIHFEPLAFTPNKIKVTNWHDFIGLEGYTLRWAVECDGKTVQNGEMDFPKIAPRNSAQHRIATESAACRRQGVFPHTACIHQARSAISTERTRGCHRTMGIAFCTVSQNCSAGGRNADRRPQQRKH